MIPQKKQWKKWSLPSKLTAIGTFIGLIALIITIIYILISFIFQRINPPATRHQVNEVVKEVKEIKQLALSGNFSENRVEIQLDKELAPAFKELTQAFQKKKQEALKLYREGIVFFDHNLYKKALSKFSKALKIIEIPAFHFSRGNAFYHLDRKEEAVIAYNKALEIKPDLHEAWYNKGVALNDLGREEEAIEAYEKALYFSEKNEPSDSKFIRKRIDRLKAKMN